MKSRFADASEKALRNAYAQGKIIICECVAAEVYPAFVNSETYQEFIHDWQIDFIPSSLKSAELAGLFYQKYIKRGGTAKRVLPDFLIGAHATVYADQLLARDRGYLRDYFTDLEVWDPVV